MRHRRDRGASSVEYGLMVGAIAALVVGLAFGLGGLLGNAFSKTSSCISAGNPTAANC